MKSYIYIVFSTFLFTYPSVLIAQDQNSNQVKNRIEAQRIAFLTKHIDLRPEEAQEFWPVYNEYRDREEELNKMKRPEIQIQNMSDTEASAYLDKMVELGEREIIFKKEFLARFREVLSDKKVLLFFDAERRFKEKLLQHLSGRNDGSRN